MAVASTGEIRALTDSVAYSFYRLELNRGFAKLNQLTDWVEQMLRRYPEREAWIREVNELMEFIVVCLRNEDYILVADLVKFELPHVIEKKSEIW